MICYLNLSIKNKQKPKSDPIWLLDEKLLVEISVHTWPAPL